MSLRGTDSRKEFLPASAIESRRKPAGAAEVMSVLAVTIFVGVVLVAFFVAMFLRQTVGPHAANERDALLPLAAEKPRRVKTCPVPLTNHSTKTV
jgi:hypothetical protein